MHTWYMAAVAAAAAYFAWRVAASVPSSTSSRSSSLHTSAFFCDLSLIQKPTSQSFFATARRINNLFLELELFRFTAFYKLLGNGH